jgi:hypothetical protein
MTPTNYRTPKTGDRPLRVQFRNGYVSRFTYTAKQLRWGNTGHDFDIIAVERAREA